MKYQYKEGKWYDSDGLEVPKERLQATSRFREISESGQAPAMGDSIPTRVRELLHKMTGHSSYQAAEASGLIFDTSHMRAAPASKRPDAKKMFEANYRKLKGGYTLPPKDRLLEDRLVDPPKPEQIGNEDIDDPGDTLPPERDIHEENVPTHEDFLNMVKQKVRENGRDGFRTW